MVGPLRPKFVVMGSSIVQYSHYEQGFGAILTHLYARKADIMFRGYAGWNSRRAVAILNDVFPKTFQPALVIVYFGGNDSTVAHSSGLGPHVPPQEYVNNIKTIVNHLQGLSENIRIIFLTTPPINDIKISETSDGNKEKTNEICRQYANLCLYTCSDLGITCIDLWTKLQDRDDWGDFYLRDDGTHLTHEGNERVAKEILNVLKVTEDGKPKLHWASMPTEFGENSDYDPVAPDGKSTINVSESIYPYKLAEWK